MALEAHDPVVSLAAEAGVSSLSSLLTSVDWYSVMSGLLPARVTYAHIHCLITVARLRNPMSRKTWTTDQRSHATQPENFFFPNSATAR